jgi:hypothetical protein
MKTILKKTPCGALVSRPSLILELQCSKHRRRAFTVTGHFVLMLFLVAHLALGQPTITSQPTDQTVNQGFTATFLLRAAGTEPLAYRWHFNAAAIDGTLTNSLFLANAQPASAGNYFCVVSDSIGAVTSRIARLTVVARASLNPKVLTNVWFGVEPANLPTNRLGQVEPHIVRSFRDPAFLAATWLEGRHPSGGGAIALGAAVSRDSGKSWQRSVVPNLTTNADGRFERTTDPVIGIDADGTLYLASIGFGATGTNNPGSILVSKSRDGGVSFEPPRTVFGTINTSVYLDKPWFSVNDFPASPTANRLAVAWIEVGLDAAGNDASATTYLSVSDSNAATWSRPSLIARSTVHPEPLFLPDGSLAIFYQPFPGFSWIDVAVSESGGTNFDRRTRVASYSPYWDPNTRQSGQAAVCTDRLAGVLYVAFQANFGEGTNRAPRIVFTRSIDKGRTWSQPLAVNDTPNKGSVFNPAIAVSPDGQHVLIAFCDKRHDNGSGFFVDLYLAESFNGGLSWEPNVRLTPFPSDLRKAPLVGNIYMLGDYHGIVPPLNFDAPAWVAYCDTRSGNADPVLIGIQRTRGASYEGWGRLYWDSILADGHHRDDDPDRDGFVNEAEFAFGLHPERPDASPFTVRRVPSPSGPDVLRVTVDLLSMTEPTYSISIREESTNLAQWRPDNSVTSVGPAARPWFGQYRMDVNLELGEPMRFFKVGLCNFCR